MHETPTEMQCMYHICPMQARSHLAGVIGKNVSENGGTASHPPDSRTHHEILLLPVRTREHISCGETPPGEVCNERGHGVHPARTVDIIISLTKVTVWGRPVVHKGYKGGLAYSPRIWLIGNWPQALAFPQSLGVSLKK
eukprot:667155-Pelagomonas_calceolata.AAC.2